MGASWSRTQVANAAKNANTATLRTALKSFITATKNMNTSAIRKALNNKANGNKTYKNLIANGIANAVAASRGAKIATQAAAVGLIPESKAAIAVSYASNNVNKLNQYMNSLGNLSTNAAINLYINSGRNIKSNRKINESRPVPPGIEGPTPMYKNFFNRVDARGKSNTNYTKLLNNIRRISDPASNSLVNSTANRIIKTYNKTQIKALINNKNSFEGVPRRIINKLESKLPKNETKIGPLLEAATQRQTPKPAFNKNTTVQTLLNTNAKSLALNKRANLIAAINLKLTNANVTEENKSKLRNKRGNISKLGNGNTSFLNVGIKTEKAQVGGVSRNVYYINGSTSRFIKNSNGKYIKLTNGTNGTYPAPASNASKYNYNINNGNFVQLGRSV